MDKNEWKGKTDTARGIYHHSGIPKTLFSVYLMASSSSYSSKYQYPTDNTGHYFEMAENTLPLTLEPLL